MYSLFGVCFRSDLALQLPHAPRSAEARFALQAVQGEWPKEEAGPVEYESLDDWFALRVFRDGSVEMEWRDWLSFWIDPAGHSVGYRVNDQEYPRAFEAFVGNFAVSACLLLQGEEPLHSTVVKYRGRGLGFLGPSGAGKSTLSSYLVQRGAELITDDMLRITESLGRLFAEPGLARIKLFEEPARMYSPLAFNLGRWNPLSQKYLFDFLPPTQPRAAAPLHALFYLAPAHEKSPDSIVMRSLEGMELFEALTSSTMNSRLQVADRLARQFAFATDLAGKLPVYALHYPRRHDIFPALLAAIEDVVSSPCEAD